MRDYFIKLYEFDAWANRAVLSSLKSCPTTPARAVEWLGHILIAQQFVLEVLSGRDGSWLQDQPDPTLDECERLITELHRSWQEYFEKKVEAEIRGEITFKNSRGNIVTRQVADLLAHGVNHSTYHRGQIALEVRAAGGVPAQTDIPVWVAQNKN